MRLQSKFAFDLGRPLLVRMTQFNSLIARKTWFRRFKPTDGELAAFLASLKPFLRNNPIFSFAPTHAEGGSVCGTVTLALSSDALPNTSPIEKRDIELQRLQFALKASLRASDTPTQLKTGTEAGGGAGSERQRKLLQPIQTWRFWARPRSNSSHRRTFGSGWIGSHHAYEAALLSGWSELLGDARSGLRMASNGCEIGFSFHSKSAKEQVSYSDILEISTAVSIFTVLIAVHVNYGNGDPVSFFSRRTNSRKTVHRSWSLSRPQ